MKYLISCDWDFFIRVEADAHHPDTLIAHAGTKDECKVHPGFVFDWGQSESRSREIQQIQWLSRYSAIRNIGYDPEILVNVRPCDGCVSPEKFAHDISQRFDGMSDADLWVSDSHAFGLTAAQHAMLRAHGPVRVILFDAHADLGYGALYKQWDEHKRVDCGSWLYGALASGCVQGADIIYPDWKGAYEFKQFKGAKHLKPFSRRIRTFTWSNWLANTKNTGKRVALIHLCRSSAWTPPWCDSQFQRLISNLNWSEMTCLDCTDDFTDGQRIGAWDACTPRPWNTKEAEAFAAQNREICQAAREEKA